MLEEQKLKVKSIQNQLIEVALSEGESILGIVVEKAIIADQVCIGLSTNNSEDLYYVPFDRIKYFHINAKINQGPATTPINESTVIPSDVFLASKRKIKGESSNNF